MSRDAFDNPIAAVGDRVHFTPRKKMFAEIEGEVVDVIHSSSDVLGYEVRDPNWDGLRRIWSNDGAIEILGAPSAEESKYDLLRRILDKRQSDLSTLFSEARRASPSKRPAIEAYARDFHSALEVATEIFHSNVPVDEKEERIKGIFLDTISRAPSGKRHR